jgi:hypothetical protein
MRLLSLLRVRGVGAAAAVACGALVGQAAGATVLTFDGSGLGPYAAVPEAYGDRVTSMNDVGNGFEYALGEGFTPNVVVDYLTAVPPFTVFPSGYGDLVNVIMINNSEGFGEVVLTPDPGFSVTLHSFDVAVYAGGPTPTDNRVRVLSAAGDVLFDSGDFLLALNSHQTFPTGPITSTTALRIINTSNGGTAGFNALGLDNVSFSQAAVPEPGTVALLACGALGFAWRGRGRSAGR